MEVRISIGRSGLQICKLCHQGVLRSGVQESNPFFFCGMLT